MPLCGVAEGFGGGVIVPTKASITLQGPPQNLECKILEVLFLAGLVPGWFLFDPGVAVILRWIVRYKDPR